jgi:predicted RNA-binding Zn ribbon-like protein
MELDSYADTGIVVALGLVNNLTDGFDRGKPMGGINTNAVLRRVLAVHPPSVTLLKKRDEAGFVLLAEQLRVVFGDLDRADIESAARRLNHFLAKHPATPHLAKEDGVWRMHHHPADAALIPMWTSICAEAIARMIGAQHAGRFGICVAANCDRVFIDTSKNASRRFCSLACQNRTKMAAFRARNSRD